MADSHTRQEEQRRNQRGVYAKLVLGNNVDLANSGSLVKMCHYHR